MGPTCRTRSGCRNMSRSTRWQLLAKSIQKRCCRTDLHRITRTCGCNVRRRLDYGRREIIAYANPICATQLRREANHAATHIQSGAAHESFFGTYFEVCKAREIARVVGSSGGEKEEGDEKETPQRYHDSPIPNRGYN